MSKNKPKHRTDKRAEALKANLLKRKEQARAKNQKNVDEPR